LAQDGGVAVHGGAQGPVDGDLRRESAKRGVKSSVAQDRHTRGGLDQERKLDSSCWRDKPAVEPSKYYGLCVGLTSLSPSGILTWEITPLMKTLGTSEFQHPRRKLGIKSAQRRLWSRPGKQKRGRERDYRAPGERRQNKPLFRHDPGCLGHDAELRER